MNYKFLILDKRQRVEIKGDFPQADMRLMEELKKLDIKYEFAYFDELEIKFETNTTRIFTSKTELSDFTHITLRGHSNQTQYELKRLIIDTYPNINILNAQFIKSLPYYSKIAQASVFTQNDIPFIKTFYSTSPTTTVETLAQYGIKPPFICKQAQGENLLVEKEGKNVIKKDIVLVREAHDFPESPENYIYQPFSEIGEDYRIFVSGKKIVGGWKRKAVNSFLTVSKGEYSIVNEFPQAIHDIAKKSAEAFKSDFMAIDYIYYNGEPKVLEVNMNPGFHAYETKLIGEGTRSNIALEIIKATLNCRKN